MSEPRSRRPHDHAAELARRVELSRRRLFALGIGGLAAGAVAACSSGDEEGGGAGGEATTSSTTTTLPPLPELPAGELFTLGIASGDPTDNAVILWTRLAPEPQAPDGLGGMPDEPVPVRWQVATDEAFADIVAEGAEVATAEFAHSVHADATGLASDSIYWYRFQVGDRTSPAGRTRTLPAPDADADRLVLAFASCQERGSGHYTAHAAIAADEPDLVFFLGDYIYEYPGERDGVVWPGSLDGTLASYRRQYAGYKVEPNLQAAHAACPWVVTWDDHEVLNNYAALEADLPGDVDGFDERRAIAYQTYWEHQPLRLAPPTDGTLELHRSLRFGRLAEFFVLDGRQYRDVPPCDASQDAFVNRADCPEIDEDRTMLGAEQERWLTDGLAGSDATWKGIAQQTVMHQLVLGDIVLNVDQWDGYPAARERLFGAIADEGVQNVVVLTGDIHSAGAAVLTRDGEEGERQPVAVEFVGTSISSGTLVQVADRVAPGFADTISKDTFPGLEYLNVKDNGYARCIVTPEEWRTEYVVVETVSEPTSPTRVDATLVVTPGPPNLARA